MAYLHLFGKRGAGRITEVDDADADLSVYRWQLGERFGHLRVYRNVPWRQEGPGSVTLARVVWERHRAPIPKGKVLDHRNGDTLDNRLQNLRLATYGQNKQNMARYRNNRSGYRGVCWHKGQKKWYVSISDGGHLMFLGSYDDLEVAARQYDWVSIQLWGEFARPNFPRSDYPDENFGAR